ncbi:MAG: hypothetical protein LBR29_10705 [Methylobacteriaceae bacterium]|jgi:hypothetical protein|nr:hypothetical protein [Methylobacteriaceae bacterium]
MADYYPLLVRALENIANPRPETRRKVYEKVQAALLTQLRSAQPPLSETDILRECQALDDAVLAVEQQYQAMYVESAPQTGYDALSAQPGYYADNPAGYVPPAPYDPPRYPGEPQAYPPEPQPYEPQPYYPPEQPAYADYPAAFPAADYPVGYPPPPGAEPERDTSKDIRPRIAVQPPREEITNRKRRMVVLSVAASLIVVVAILALFLRLTGHPFGFIKPVNVITGEVNSSTDIGGGTGSPLPGGLPPKSNERLGGPPVTETAETAPDAGDIEQRAFIVETLALPAPNDHKRTPGNIVWRLDNRKNSQGETESVIIGKAQFSEADLALDIQINKISDPSLPAALTMLFSFSGLSSPNARVVDTLHSSVFMMAGQDKPQMELQGAVNKLRTNRFVFALLTNPPDNIERFKRLSWFRIFIKYDTNQDAMIAFDKGPEGERIFEEALRNWQQ